MISPALFWPVAIFAVFLVLYSVDLHTRLDRSHRRERRQARKVVRLTNELDLSHNMNGVISDDPDR